MKKVLACIDGSDYTQSVSDYAVWAAERLQAPLEFLHVLQRRPQRSTGMDLSGSIGFEEQSSLLAELVKLDEQHAKLAQQRGRQILGGVVERARSQGVVAESRLRHGSLVETLTELEPDVRLFIIGKRGEHADFAKLHLGSNLERAVRAVHQPLLVASRQFKPIQNVLIAFDGSETTRKGITMIAGSPLLKNLSCHIVMAGSDTAEAQAQIQWAHETLAAAGFEVDSSILPGNAESVIADYTVRHAIDLLVMGAYGHSRIRQLIVGSTTTAMLRTCFVPVLLLR